MATIVPLTGNTTGQVTANVPSGAVLLHAGITAPSGFLICDGTAYSRATYASLFKAITIQTTGSFSSGVQIITGIPNTAGMQVGFFVSGPGIKPNTTVQSIDSPSQIHISLTTSALGTGVALVVGPHGIGDGSTTFNVPDLRSRVSIGAGQGTGLTNRILGQVYGEENHTLTSTEIPNHTHNYSGTTGTVSSDHTHGYQYFPSPTGNTDGGNQGQAAFWSNQFTNQTGGISANHTHSFSGTTDTGTVGNGAHNTIQPSYGMTHIIKH